MIGIIENKCIEIIDLCFAEFVFERTGNKLKDQSSLGILVSDITEKSIDKCIEYLNTQNPEKAKEFTKSGFINNYIKEKQKKFLGL